MFLGCIIQVRLRFKRTVITTKDLMVNMIKLAIVDSRFPEDTIKEVSPRELAENLWEVSKIRHALYSSREFIDVAEDSIKRYLKSFEPKN
jgi:hypothetical protein